MSETDTQALSAVEREELQALREEKARREREAAHAAERRELELLRAEQAAVDAEILAARQAELAAQTLVQGQAHTASKAAQVPTSSAAVKSVPEQTVSTTAATAAATASAAAHDEHLSFGQKMVMTPAETDDDGIPHMAPAQKIILILALLVTLAIAVRILFF
ncbi:hypothetical protein KPC83_02670 [Collinsella sp. zg1085]|uniref:hypothetical protein n=1 Tax=Collinsella sp. zg1085 TaxID=2844380 RepID=UPI001C0ACD49|nr:hypothetical protein [Collinsella sp. zg1085]QWT18056.1 hypothetical protein KPC83_02670 [Collinsella sp. zg1085]